MADTTAPRMLADSVPGRRGEILDAALAVFAERGYDSGSMREVAALVGVSEPALYRHFSSKEEMFLALLEAVATKLRGEAFALMDAAHAATLRDQLLLAFADRRQALARSAPLLRTVMVAAVHNPVFLDRYREALLIPMRDHLTLTAERLDLEFALLDGARDRDARVRALMALFVGTFVSGVVLADRPDEAAADAVLRVMRWG